MRVVGASTRAGTGSPECAMKFQQIERKTWPGRVLVLRNSLVIVDRKRLHGHMHFSRCAHYSEGGLDVDRGWSHLMRRGLPPHRDAQQARAALERPVNAAWPCSDVDPGSSGRK